MFCKVKILDKEYFDNVILDSNITQLKSGKWNDVYLTVTNKTNGTITTPITIKESYNELLIQEKK